MDNDTFFFRLFQFLPGTMFELWEESALLARHYEFQALEMKKPVKRRADGVFLPKKPELPVYFLEVQFYPKPNVYANLLVKLFMYFEKNKGRDWRALVLFGTRRLAPKNIEPYRTLLNAGQLRAVYLDELPKKDPSSLGWELLTLAATPKNEARGKATRLVARVREELNDRAEQESMLEFVENMILSKLPGIPLEELQAMLQLHNVKKSKVYREGAKEGREEGREEGRREGKIEAIPRMKRKGLGAKEIAELLGLDLSAVEKEMAKLEGNGRAKKQ